MTSAPMSTTEKATADEASLRGSLQAMKYENRDLRRALRKFVRWHARASVEEGDKGNNYLNEGGWEDCGKIAALARAALGDRS